MKNGEILTLYETLERISKNKDLKFNVRVGYAIMKNKEKLRQEAVLIYNMRREIIMEHGRAEGKDIVVSQEFIDETNRKIEDLMNIENDLQIIKFPAEVFNDYEMNMEDLEGLILMIEPFEFTGLPQEKTDG